jgi:hypothetical protein
MMNALLRARRLIWLWALGSAMATIAIILQQDSTSLIESLLHPNVWIAGMAGLLIAAAMSPILTARWMRWYWGALIGLPMGGIVMFCFFFAEPHAWQASRIEAWKSVGLFVTIYPLIIIPAALLTGGIGTLLICKDDEPSGVEE